MGVEEVRGGQADEGAVIPVRNENHATLLREDLETAGCAREALFADDEMRAPIGLDFAANQKKTPVSRGLCVVKLCRSRAKEGT